MYQYDEWTQGRSADAALYDRFAASIFGYARLSTPSWEDAEEPTAISHTIEHKKAGDQIEMLLIGWQRLDEVGHLIGDGLLGSLRIPSHVMPTVCPFGQKLLR